MDAMGGDHAPRAAIDGSVLAAKEDGSSILLVGDSEIIERRLAAVGPIRGSIDVIHADEVVEMGEPAITPLRRKPRSSVRICAELVRDGRANAMVTAGNTGAAVTVAYKQIGMIPGVDRPGLAAVLPTRKGRTVLLDVGGTVDMRPTHYRQFAVMGHLYAKEVLHTAAPTIGLLSIGEEDSKGTELTREVFGVLEKTGLNFVGNVEGNDVFTGRVDVVVCDGFVGNVLLKGAEAVADLLIGALRDEVAETLRSRIGYLLLGPAIRNLRLSADYSEYGAAPLLGVEGGCFIAHGRADARALQSAIRRAVEFCEADLHRTIRVGTAEMHAQEESLLGEGGI